MQQEKTIVKRLEKLEKAVQPEHAGSRRKDAGAQYFTEAVCSRNEAIESKLKLLRGSFFGRPIVKFEVKNVTDVWVPYCYLEYDFAVERNIMFRKKGLMKTGKVGLVFDMNEMHPFQYDLYESGELPLKKGRVDGKQRKLLECSNSMHDVKAKAEEYLQFRVMKKFYGTEARLRLDKERPFFRPAVEIEVLYKGKNSNLRYAYLDEFAVESEHVLGLKYRVDNNF
ncbi:hypothetical protein NE619_10235 [Anaerovorax odorimutans]|uniref:VTC domain-containing protein n=1 Tax=Anaerovorax odorimutans TaxID=109327 RepID=A0ABT1RPK8_9FIRM|nr:hypothetical protein [Anaerovorax odorimutans]MCQ4637104.1 hypothetical protein [Anaerovorax odorimutans]